MRRAANDRALHDARSSGEIERGTSRHEKHLQQQYGLALVTVRKSVKFLRDQGLVRTVPGWGTFVTQPEDRQEQ